MLNYVMAYDKVAGVILEGTIHDVDVEISLTARKVRRVHPELLYLLKIQDVSFGGKMEKAPAAASEIENVLVKDTM